MRVPNSYSALYGGNAGTAALPELIIKEWIETAKELDAGITEPKGRFLYA
ncbi:type II toxin-antitoxin system HicB family antitoxin [candidate division KSB1 bacterium]|nr:type II toxin-antitoxin system HicB family antitoxin [candidate division KSB1 bacterium]